MVRSAEQEFREFIDRFDSGQLGGGMLRVDTAPVYEKGGSLVCTPVLSRSW